MLLEHRPCNRSFTPGYGKTEGRLLHTLPRMDGTPSLSNGVGSRRAAQTRPRRAPQPPRPVPAQPRAHRPRSGRSLRAPPQRSARPRAAVGPAPRTSPARGSAPPGPGGPGPAPPRAPAAAAARPPAAPRTASRRPAGTPPWPRGGTDRRRARRCRRGAAALRPAPRASGRWGRAAPWRSGKAASGRCGAVRSGAAPARPTPPRSPLLSPRRRRWSGCCDCTFATGGREVRGGGAGARGASPPFLSPLNALSSQ